MAHSDWKIDTWATAPNGDGLRRFQLGTVHGGYQIDGGRMYVIVIANEEEGNGLLRYALDELEAEAQRLSKQLIFSNMMSARLLYKLTMRGYICVMDSEGMHMTRGSVPDGMSLISYSDTSNKYFMSPKYEAAKARALRGLKPSLIIIDDPETKQK